METELADCDLGLAVFKIEEKATRARELAEKSGARVQKSTSTSLTLRVPAKAFESLLAELEKLRAELSQHKMEKEYVSWLDTLRKQTYISRKGIYAESSARP